MIASVERDMWEELRCLYSKILEWERKIEETIEQCPAWELVKLFVYSTLIIKPVLLVLVTLTFIWMDFLQPDR